MNIAVIVPTIRPEQYETFKNAWHHLIDVHHVHLFTVMDGDEPTVNGLTAQYVMGNHHHLIYNKSDVVRNLGFVYAKKQVDPDVYITLDDDVLPYGDTIQDHLDALETTSPAMWMSTATDYVRGIPYGIRSERETVVSHGVWHGVKDWDAPTQLVRGNPDVEFYKGHIPQSVYFPFCGMNIAFKRQALPYMYYAPMGPRVNLDRFGDIWLGIILKDVCDEKGWGIATGYAAVEHNRASNVWKNLQKEARGLELNEWFWCGIEDDPYFEEYKKRREEWYDYITSLDR